MENWSVRVEGDEAALEKVSRSFSNDRFKLVKEPSGYMLYSSAFGDIQDPNEVREKAVEIIKSVRGAIRHTLGADPKLKVNLVMRTNSDGTKNGFISFNSKVAVSSSATADVQNADGTVEHRDFEKEAFAKAMAALQEHPAVSEVMNFWGKERNWFNLYKIFELIRKDAGGEQKLIKNGLITKSEMSRFTNSANNRKASGDDARHGVSHHQPPANPMTLDDGKGFIDRLIREWLELKK